MGTAPHLRSLCRWERIFSLLIDRIFKFLYNLQIIISEENKMAELDINEQNFEQEVVSSDVPVLLDFWAPWCGPCKMLMPVVEELAKEYDGKIKVGKVNTDENMSLSSKFQITSIPCLIIFKNGKPINKMVGFRPKNDIKKEIDNVL